MVARDDMFAVPEDTPRVLDVTANDSAGDVGPFTLAQVSNPGHGTASLTPDGKVLYAPDANKNGPDSLDYTLRARDGTTATAKAIITVTPVNDPPIAVNDAYTAKTLRGISIGAGNGVLANDHDVDGDPLTVTKAVSLLITIHPDGSISFPLPVLGVTNVQYTVSDGTTTATATAKFTVSLFRAAGSPAFIARPDTATRF